MSPLGAVPPAGHGNSPRARNLAARAAAERRSRRLRIAAFVATVGLVLGGGVYVASADLLGQRGTASVAGAITMRISMAGYDPNVLHAKPGETLTIDWWNTDNSMHLDGGGVHTLIAPELGISETLPAESRKLISITAPDQPGDYDFYCDSCCGGKESPTMHGTLRVQV